MDSRGAIVWRTIRLASGEWSLTWGGGRDLSGQDDARDAGHARPVPHLRRAREVQIWNFAPIFTAPEKRKLVPPKSRHQNHTSPKYKEIAAIQLRFLCTKLTSDHGGELGKRRATATKEILINHCRQKRQINPVIVLR